VSPTYSVLLSPLSPIFSGGVVAIGWVSRPDFSTRGFSQNRSEGESQYPGVHSSGQVG